MTRQRTVTRFMAGLWAASILVAACGASSDGDGSGDAVTTAPPPDSTSEAQPEPEPAPEPEPETEAGTESDDVGAGGNPAAEAYVVELAGGVTLDVPAGERDDVAATLVSGSLADGDVVFDLQPAGAVFDEPLVMTIPYSVEAGQMIGAGVILAGDDGEALESLPVTIGESAIHTEIPHFSEISVHARFVDLEWSPSDVVMVGDSASIGPAPGDATEWNVTTSSPEGIASSTDVVNGVWTCDSPGTTNVLVGADSVANDPVESTDGGVAFGGRFGRSSVTSYAGQLDLTCLAVPAALNSSNFIVTQFHDTGALPEALAAVGAFSAVVVEAVDAVVAEAISATALLFDANGSGVPDSGDQFLFGPQPIVDGAAWNPIDQGGGYFVFTFDVDADQVVPTDAVQIVEIGAAPGQFIVDGSLFDVVVSEMDDAAAALYNVDFGDPLMVPQVP